MRVLLSMVAPGLPAAAQAAQEAQGGRLLWGVALEPADRAWSVEDAGGPAWLLIWLEVQTARAVKRAAPGAWGELSWRRARLASLDAADRALLPDEDRERLAAAAQ